MVPCPRDKVDVEIRKRILQDITVVENEERTAKKLKTAKESAAITKHFTPVPKETAANLAILEFLIANGNKSTRKKPLKLKLSAQPCQKKKQYHGIVEPYSEVERRCGGKYACLLIYYKKIATGI